MSPLVEDVLPAPLFKNTATMIRPGSARKCVCGGSGQGRTVQLPQAQYPVSYVDGTT